MVKKHAGMAADKSKCIEKETDATTEVTDELKARRQQEQRRKEKLKELKNHLKTLENELAAVVEHSGLQVGFYT